MQLFSNDARLGELVDDLDDGLEEHKKDTNAHANGIAGNATTATKMKTARTLDGVAFDGSAAIIHYGTCSTAAATAEKVVEVPGFSLVTGAIVLVKFTVTNTADSPTLNVNSTGAKAIQYRGAAITAGYLAANRTYIFVYDGAQYQLVGDVDTDTHYATHMYAGSGTAANATTTNGNTKLTVTDNSTVRNNVTIKGTGATTVVSDASGNITINSTNTTYSNMTAATASAAGKAGLVPAPAAGKQASFLRGDGTWVVPTNTTYSVFTGADGTNAGSTGLVPKPAASKNASFLRGDGAWAVPTNTNNISASSVAANGYIKFNNGLIIQWGKTTAKNASVTFPVSFSSACYSCVCTCSGGDWCWSGSVSKTGFSLNGSSPGYWCAIGK